MFPTLLHYRQYSLLSSVDLTLGSKVDSNQLLLQKTYVALHSKQTCWHGVLLPAWSLSSMHLLNGSLSLPDICEQHGQPSVRLQLCISDMGHAYLRFSPRCRATGLDSQRLVVAFPRCSCAVRAVVGGRGAVPATAGVAADASQRGME